MPPYLWQCIVIVVTAKTSKHSFIDHDATLTAFINSRQRASESIAEYENRIKTIVQTFHILDMSAPSPAQQALRFLQGLDPIRYNNLKSYVVNENAKTIGTCILPIYQLQQPWRRDETFLELQEHTTCKHLSR